jgi:hypothetical protein
VFKSIAGIGKFIYDFKWMRLFGPSKLTKRWSNYEKGYADLVIPLRFTGTHS